MSYAGSTKHINGYNTFLESKSGTFGAPIIRNVHPLVIDPAKGVVELTVFGSNMTPDSVIYIPDINGILYPKSYESNTYMEYAGTCNSISNMRFQKMEMKLVNTYGEATFHIYSDSFSDYWTDMSLLPLSIGEASDDDIKTNTDIAVITQQSNGLELSSVYGPNRDKTPQCYARFDIFEFPTEVGMDVEMVVDRWSDVYIIGLGKPLNYFVGEYSENIFNTGILLEEARSIESLVGEGITNNKVVQGIFVPMPNSTPMKIRFTNSGVDNGILQFYQLTGGGSPSQWNDTTHLVASYQIGKINGGRYKLKLPKYGPIMPIIGMGGTRPMRMRAIRIRRTKI